MKKRPVVLQLAPHQARRALNCDEAWWYEEENSIHVFCYDKKRGGMSCKIDRRAIEGWLKRAAAHRSRKGKKG